MATNGTSSSSNGLDTSNNILTITAFIVSLVALGVSLLQLQLAFLQYDASRFAKKYCGTTFMEDWAQKTASHFKLDELRFEVFFEVPVFYTAPPGYMPIANRQGSFSY